MICLVRGLFKSKVNVPEILYKVTQENKCRIRKETNKFISVPSGPKITIFCLLSIIYSVTSPNSTGVNSRPLRYWIILLATGAATALPEPPSSTTTATTYLGLLIESIPTNQEVLFLLPGF